MTHFSFDLHGHQGAELLTGGERIGTKGSYLTPTVFANISDDMTVFKEEVFGPVMTINRFKSTDSLPDLLTRVNDSPYGLAAGVFTSDLQKGNAMVKGMRAGMVFWN